MTRPPDRFADHFQGRDAAWDQLTDWIERGEGRGIREWEEGQMYDLFTAFLPEHQSDYPSGMSRLEVWYERQQAFMDLQQFIDQNYDGDYDLSDFIDDEADWRENYEQIS